MEQATDTTGFTRGPRLVAVWTGGAVVRDLPEVGVLVLGRGDVDVRLDDASVSRRHARLRFGADVRVEDLGSSNGTFVDGEPVVPGEARVVPPGALLEIGSVLVVLRGPDAFVPPPGLVVADPEMQRVHELATLAAKSDLPVLLRGEAGVGKDVLASRLHALSPRALGPLVKVDCGALAEALLDAELFGYEKGTFTGAAQAKAGLLETSSGGTLLLDEVSLLSVATQAKLLRVLESGQNVRLGSTKPRAVDVRIVATTTRDLRTAIVDGHFRQDLYVRLDGVAIRVPALRDRPHEIAPLARLFAEQTTNERGGEPVSFTDAALERLVQYPWPGNVRELKELVVRTVLFGGRGRLDVADLRFQPAAHGTGETAIPRPAATPPAIALARTALTPPAIALPRGFDEADRRRILHALEQCGGNQTRAAKLLGVSRGTLVNRLNAMNAPRPRK